MKPKLYLARLTYIDRETLAIEWEFQYTFDDETCAGMWVDYMRARDTLIIQYTGRYVDFDDKEVYRSTRRTGKPEEL